MIQDLEEGVEHVAPAHVREVDSCVLVGGRKVQSIPMDPLRQLMSRRVDLDQKQVQALRAILPSKLGYHLYRSPDDPKRLLRLGVSLPVNQVVDADDQDFTSLARELGPAIQEKKLEGLHCVYLVGAQDHVRLQPGPFIDDVLQKWEDHETVTRIAEERARKEKEERIKRVRDKERMLAELAARRETRIVKAPVTRMIADVDASITARSAVRAAPPVENTREQHRLTERTYTRSPGDADRGLDRIRLNIDRMEEGRTAIRETTEETRYVAPTETRTPQSPAGNPLTEALERNGFQVLQNPTVPGHTLTAAAERAGAYPQRVIALDANRITRHDAENLLQAARTLDTDMALAVGDAIDNEARALILASKVKWTKRSELPRLSL